eukprot:10488412-Prorocentrum_lima.AAC.1
MDAALSLYGQKHSGNLRPRGPGGRPSNARPANGVGGIMGEISPFIGPRAPVGASRSNDGRPSIDVPAHG